MTVYMAATMGSIGPNSCELKTSTSTLFTWLRLMIDRQLLRQRQLPGKDNSRHEKDAGQHDRHQERDPNHGGLLPEDRRSTWRTRQDSSAANSSSEREKRLSISFSASHGEDRLQISASTNGTNTTMARMFAMVANGS